jgi:RNA polymerase sigma-54 factor
MLKQSLRQKLLQRLSPLQIQTIKLIELPMIQLEERIKKELEENPVLEEDDSQLDGRSSEATDDRSDDEFSFEDYIDDDETPTYKVVANNGSKERSDDFFSLTNIPNLRQILEEQLAFQYLDDREHVIGLFIIGSIDNDGYLRRNLSSVADDIAFKTGIEASVAELEAILDIIHTFDPPGAGAQTLRECLLIQLRHKTDRTGDRIMELAETIVEKYFDEFSKKHYRKIAEALDLDDDTLRAVVDEILKLNPKPGSGYENMYAEQARQIIPDFILELKNGDAELSLNSYEMPELKINREYLNLVERYGARKKKSRNDRETVAFVRQKIESAQWFIEAVKQRRQTLLKTMLAILEFQKEYFKTGDESDLRPMILRDISEMTDLDVSTVSRVVNSKYLQCDRGVFSLRYFFSEGILSDTGEEVSTKEVKNIINGYIENEDKQNPLTDEDIRIKLGQKGYNIARRTVAKYREKMNLPVARLRRKL